MTHPAIDEDNAVEAEEILTEDDPFRGLPPYQCMTCSTCIHLVEDNVCIALPPMPVLMQMMTSKPNQQIIDLSKGKAGQAITTMKYTAVYPQIARPDRFRACSMYIMNGALLSDEPETEIVQNNSEGD